MRRFTCLLLVGGISFTLIAALMSWLSNDVRTVLALEATTTYVVNSTADTPDADVGIPACADASGSCTLRAAIMQANFTAGPDTINLPAGVYVLTRAGNDDADVLGDLDITDDLTIQGAGSGTTIVDGNGAVTGDRVFQVLSSAKVTSFSGLVIRNGKKTAGSFDEGGGLYWDGNGGQLHFNDVIFEGNASRYGGGLYLNYSTSGDAVEMNHVVVHANTATAAAGGLGINFGDFASFELLNSQVYSNTAYEGGGIYFQGTPSFGLLSVRIENSNAYSNTASLSAGFENHSGNATVPVKLQNSHLYNNHATYYGGAIGNYGTLSIYTTTLDTNSAVIRGGGIYNYEGGQLDIEQSTLNGNSAKLGGGIFSELFLHNNARLALLNSTLSGNTASRYGGGIFAQGGQARLYNATIADNQVLVPNGNNYLGLGGGLYITGTATIDGQNLLLANNTHKYSSSTPERDDCFGTLHSLGYNLIQSTTNCIIGGTTTGNITGQDPRLGPLGYYGGSTQTQSPFPGSPAIDAGENPFCSDFNGTPILTDQGGFQRPSGPRCDIGAVESPPSEIYLPFLNK